MPIDQRLEQLADVLWEVVGAPGYALPEHRKDESIASFLSCLSEDIFDPEAAIECLSGFVANLRERLQVVRAKKFQVKQVVYYRQDGCEGLGIVDAHNIKTGGYHVSSQVPSGAWADMRDENLQRTILSFVGYVPV